MPESLSVTDSAFTSDTGHSDVTGGSVTLGKVQQHRYTGHNDALPQLPSHKFQYSVWHDLRETCLTGDQLHAPRVREGPPVKKKEFYHLEEDGVPIHHALRGTQKQNHMDEFENWEESKVINLCYQDLSHDYQKKNFMRILTQCQSALTVNLNDNELENLKKITFSRCEYLNLNNNYIDGFNLFPRTPKVRSIRASWNTIKTYNGLEWFASTPLEELDLQGNPISFTLNYRQNVFSKLPQLRMLDGVCKGPSDQIFSDDRYPGQKDEGCCIL